VNVRLAVVAALEALEVGDIDYCAAILLGALEDVERPVGVRCKTCGHRADWPGLLDTHQCSGYFTEGNDYNDDLWAAEIASELDEDLWRANDLLNADHKEAA
jgi:hypothetical protein